MRHNSPPLPDVKMAATPKPPLMGQRCSLFQNVDLEKRWKYCTKLQNQWIRKFSIDDKYLALRMTTFRKNSAITFVCAVEELDRRHPNQSGVYYVLSQLYDNPDSPMNIVPGTILLRLKQHLVALRRIIDAADQKQNLSEELILSVYQDLMGDTRVNDREGYRNVPASIGCHTFPDHTIICNTMGSIVAKYNGFRRDCDMFERASWLLQRILSLHPFHDGNGRLGRLLWCFSLLRDGLPFLPIPQIDHDKYVKCIIEDSRMLQPQTSLSPCLTSLTVVSVKEKWENFLSNLSLEYPEGYSMICTFLFNNGLQE